MLYTDDAAFLEPTRLKDDAARIARTPEPLWLSPRVAMTVLPNGMRVVSETMPQMHSVAISIGVDVGARHEEVKNNGVSHMLEHMAFKGTHRRNALQIAEEFDAIGGNLNAYTSMEHTVYYARVLREDVRLAMDILADILQHSTFVEEELERERGVILQEIAMHQDAPEEFIFDRLAEVAYPGQAVGRSILGTVETVSGMTAEDLRQYIATHYRGPRMVLSAAGNITHAELVDYAQAFFGDLPGGLPYAPTQAAYHGGDERVEKPLEQVHAIWAFPTVSYNDPRYRTLQLLSTVLGGGMSSRLFQEVREKRGLAYSIYAFASSHADSGLFGIYAGTGEKEAGQVTQIIADELHKLTRDLGVPELERAKTQMKASIKMAQENVSSQCETLTRHVLCYGRPKAVEEIIREIDAVQVEQVTSLLCDAARYPLSLAAIGPIQRMPEKETLAKLFKV